MKKKRTLLGTLLAIFMIAAMPAAAFATDFADNNLAGKTVDSVAADKIMDINEGTVTNAYGDINHNYGTVSHNYASLSYNYEGGTVVENNGDGDVIYNYEGAVVKTNNAKVSWNYGTVETNKGYTTENFGTVKNNEGTVETNYGTVENNQGRILYNLGGTVTGTPAEESYAYKISFSNMHEVSMSANDNDMMVMEDGCYVKEGASVTIFPSSGYIFDGEPTVTSGTLTKNEDGNYTLSNIKADITLTANMTFVPAEDITGVPASILTGEYFLNSNTAVTPSAASQYIVWQIVDAGTTGAELDPNGQNLTTTAPGTVKLEAHVMSGASPTESFIKTFTISVRQAEIYTVTFNANGGSGTMDAQSFTEGQAQNLDTNAFTKEGYSFAGWNTAADKSGTTYGNEEYLEVTANMTLYAQWVPIPEVTPTPEPIPEVTPIPEPTPEVTPTPEPHQCVFEQKITKATKTKNGKIVMKCDCGKIKSTTTIYKIKSAKLSKVSYVYDGKAKKPAVTVRNSKGNKISSKYYTVTYKKNKVVGKATVTIKFKGRYSGTITKTFKIKPIKPVIKKPAAAKKAVTVKWNKVKKQTTGYQVMVATNKKFTKNVKKTFVKGYSKTSKKMTGLKAKKTYYVKVRTYKTVGKVKYYSEWSAVKICKTK